jgi:hypothetical protein
MTTRTRKRLLLSFSIAVLAATAWSVYALAIRPPEMPETADSAKRRTPVKAGKKSLDQLGPLDAYAVTYRQPLGKPLFDRPIAAKSLQLTLLYTVVQADRKMAMLRIAGDETLEVREGETVEDAQIVNIRDGRVELTHNGQSYVLTLQDEGR